MNDGCCPIHFRYNGLPSLGSKERDSKDVFAPLVAARKPKLIALACAGLGKELCAVPPGDFKLVVADSDPAIRAWWAAANAGLLEAAGEQARMLWWACREETLDHPDPVLAAWEFLRERQAEHEALDVIEYAAWAMCIFAGSHGGKRRLNRKTGQCNISTVPKSKRPDIVAAGGRDPEWLTSRLLSRERLAATDAWMAGRLAAPPFASFDELFDWLGAGPLMWGHDVHGAGGPCALSAATCTCGGLCNCHNAERVLLAVDPPYGSQKFEVYDGLWTIEKRDRLARLTLEAVAAGAGAAVWCDDDDARDAFFAPEVRLGDAARIGTDPKDWQIVDVADGRIRITREEALPAGVPALIEATGGRPARVNATVGFGDVVEFRTATMTWRRRDTNVHMKSGGLRKDGTVEPDRKGAGGWIGVSRE